MKAMEKVVEENEVKPLTVEQLELYKSQSESESDDSVDEEEEDDEADEDEEDDYDEEEDNNNDVQEVVQSSGDPPIHSVGV